MSDAGVSVPCPTCGQGLIVPPTSAEDEAGLLEAASPPAVGSLTPTRGLHKKTAPWGRKKKFMIGILARTTVVIISIFTMTNRSAADLTKTDPDLTNTEAIKNVEKVAVEVKILQSRIQNGESLLYLPNKETPYTGWMKEILSDGAIELTQIKNGILNGPYVEYLESGQKAIEGINLNGSKHGKQTLWYKNGQINSELIFKNGKVDSLLVNYKQNGEKCSESKVENGNGKLLSYDSEGKVTGTLRFESGEGIFRLNKPDPDQYTMPNMKALIEQEIRQGVLKSKLINSGEYNDKTYFLARITSISDTDWSECDPALLGCAKTLVELAFDKKTPLDEVIEKTKTFNELVAKRVEEFVFIGADTVKIIENAREKISKEKDYQ